MTYFALLEAFSHNGCPVCRVMAESSRRYLDGLFYEQVNDVSIRRKLRRARGFCNWHAWQGRTITSSALGVAIIAKDLLTEEMARLDDLVGHLRGTARIPPQSLRVFLRGWRQRAMCPVCEIILEHERHALETILNFLPEAEFARRMESAAALCVIHTMRVTEMNGAHPQLRVLIEMQRRKYAHLVGELEGFCRKHDHQFSHESWGAESDSWLRAIELLAGKPDVFGSDVRRKVLRDDRSRWWIKLFNRWRAWRRAYDDVASGDPHGAL